LTNYFGPAYALSLAVCLQRLPHEKTITHPSFVARIFIALQYLTRMKKENRLPVPVGQHIGDVSEYLEKIWSQHKVIDSKESQEKVETIYNSAENDVINVISEKTQPFSEFLKTNQEERRKIHGLGSFEYVERQVFSVSDVAENFESGIPVATDPRILYNAFISHKSQEMFQDPRLRTFILESLKKWHLKKAWLGASSR